MGKQSFLYCWIYHPTIFVKRRVARFIGIISEKIWGGRTPSEVLSKRFKLFVFLGIFLIGISKLLYWAGITFHNLELIVPTLVVIGSFSLYCGGTKFWRGVTRYFGVIALISVVFIDLVIWGFRPIYAFTWSGFILCWFLGMQNKLPMFDKFKSLLWQTTLTAAVAILLFDLYTGVLGWSLLTGIGPASSFLAQVPFTLYHLCSLIFVPPLVALGKAMVKVKIPVPVAVAVKRGISIQELEGR